MGNDHPRDRGAQGRRAPDTLGGSEGVASESQAHPALGATPHGPQTGGRLSDGRFRLRRRLGAGGMGVVYEAYDAVQDTLVALKTLSHLEASSLYFLKNEFRTLADLVHPNLVALHGLFSDGEHWFITMELVDGVPFVDHVRGRAAPYAADGATVNLPAGLTTPSAVQESVFRRSLRQLVHGVLAIHAAGKIHRDLKPSNVLVSSAGRVVILDFGLAAEDTHEVVGQTLQGGLLGTPAYMAPEQLIGLPASPASDWYSVGVMLYQALVGDVPFSGRFHEVFAAKQRDPPRPSASAPGLPKELDELCVALLAREPEARPSAARILEFLTEDAPESQATLRSAPPAPVLSVRTETFVGRTEELRVLRAALEATEEGRAVGVLVTGTSGMGKTALVEHFLSEQRARGRAVVLSGRCYERESVAFKALDALIDSLSRYLRRAQGAEAFLPRDVRALVRVFPVLERVEVIAESRQRRVLPADPQELRKRAFRALREMFARIADRAPLVVFVDDLQWGDVDSALVLREILAPPDPPAMLFVGTCRSDERGTSPCMTTLTGEGGCSWVEIPIGTLADADASELAERLLGGVTGPSLDAVRREGRGSPFFITELVRYLEQRVAGADASSAAVLTLDRALQRRVSLLSDAARRCLVVLAVAAHPVQASVVATVSGLGRDVYAGLRALTSLKLARRLGVHEEGDYTTYHDRIRESVAGALGKDELCALHTSLAETLERESGGEVDVVVEHLLAAGDVARAAQYAVRAASLAEATLAFDRAARFYALAVEQGVLSPERDVELRTKLGSVLFDAGRSSEAAEVFLEAARRAKGSQVGVLRQRAAEQLLLSGHLDSGLSMLRETAGAQGLELPASPADADLALFGAFSALRERGLDFASRSELEVSLDTVARIDLFGSLALAQLTVDTAEGTLFTIRHLLVALEAGEPRRVARALALYAFCTGGILPTDDILDRVEALAKSVGSPDCRAWAHMTRAVLPYWQGDFVSATTEFERAEATFREECRGTAREVGAVRLMLTSALWHAEEIERVAACQARFLADARERSDLYLVTWSYVRAHYTRLAEDQADLGVAEVEEGVRRWGRQRFDFITWQSDLAFAMFERYRGGTGLGHVTRHWSEVQENPGFSQCPVHRALTYRERCFASLAAAARTAAGAERAALLHVAEGDAEVVAGTGILGGPAFLDLARAAVANIVGDRARAEAHLTAGFDGYRKLPIYRITAELLRRQHGRLVGGVAGRKDAEAAEAAIRKLGVASVERWAATFLPGFEGQA